MITQLTGCVYNQKLEQNRYIIKKFCTAAIQQTLVGWSRTTNLYLQLLIAYKSRTKRDREIYVKYPRDAILIYPTTVVSLSRRLPSVLACLFR